MPSDANLIIRGLYSSALVALDESDAVATTIAANSDGNAVVDLRKTGKKGLAAVLKFVTNSGTAPYSDEATLLIEASDYLDRGWLEVARFPTIIPYRRKMVRCTATTGFVAADTTTPRVLTASSDGATGLIVDIAQELYTVGGVGDIVISMEDSADVYATAGDTLTATSGTGVATQGAASVEDNSRGHPGGTLVIRFVTDKRYVRFNGETVADDLGTCWVTIEDDTLDKL